MKICVLGLWHLGSVTAACLASAGHQVVGLDFDLETVNALRNGVPPIDEPGLEGLVQKGIHEGSLSFTSDIEHAAQDIDLLWITYDTPVDSDDQADVQFVMDRVERVLPHVRSNTVVLISSQLPVGSTRKLEAKYKPMPERNLSFAYSPENLRLGKAIAAFTQPERVIVGIRSERERPLLEALFGTFTNCIEWMSVESAEMTKHALNAFLATSVSFINEIGVICEAVGADAKQVERGLKSEPRIGPRAYLSPGGAFAGGTLARDITFLVNTAERHEIPTYLLRAVRASNDDHRQWARRKISTVLGNLSGQVIAIWGLTYKPGTDTLRRSSSVELCEWLFDQGSRVQAHDPAVKSLPPALANKIRLCPTPLDALEDATVLVIATEWPEYAVMSRSAITSRMRSTVILDPTRLLAKEFDGHPDVRYFTVGKG